MNFSQRQADPRRHLVGISVVILFHLIVVYALVTGLAKKVVDVIRAPIETKVIEEIKKPPPPQEIVPPPPPKLEAPPPPFIPPPEVQIATPPPAQPTITATTPTPPPPAPMMPVQAPPVVAAAPPAPPPPVPTVVSAGAVCPNYTAVSLEIGFPREASRLNLEKGEATIQFTLTASGEIKDIKTLKASHPVFARSSIRAVGDFKCSSSGREVTVVVPFSYKTE